MQDSRGVYPVFGDITRQGITSGAEYLALVIGGGIADKGIYRSLEARQAGKIKFSAITAQAGKGHFCF